MGDKICVLGAGNGGQSMAADLASRGWDVTLFELPRFRHAIEVPLKTGTLTLTERGVTSVVPVRVTTDIQEALSDARIINVVVPANGHDYFFEAILPHLTSEQLVVVWSGRLGALRLLAMGLRAGRTDLQVVEVNTLAYGARLDGPGHPHILYRATQMFAAACPVTATPDVLQRLQEFYPEIPIRDAGNVLGAGLANSSLLVLPTGTVLNAGAIDNADGEYYLTRDGLTTHVTRVIGALNRELVEVGAGHSASPCHLTRKQCLSAPEVSSRPISAVRTKTHRSGGTASYGSTCRAGTRSAGGAQAGKSIPNGSNGAPRSTTGPPKSRTGSSSGAGNRTASSGCTAPARYTRPWSDAPGSCTRPGCPDQPRRPPWTHRSGSTKRCPHTRSRP